VVNRLTTVASDTYGYDPSNKRVWKNDEFTFWGARGERIGRYTVAKLVDPTSAHVFVFQKVSVDEYFGGRRLTTMDAFGSVGSYYPYGEPRTGTPSNTDAFATYYRDSTGLDYAQQRYYQSVAGRFAAPDPYSARSKGVDNASAPSTWNRYSYAANDPANFGDPKGNEPWWWFDLSDSFAEVGIGDPGGMGAGGNPCFVSGFAGGSFCALQIPIVAYQPPSERASCNINAMAIDSYIKNTPILGNANLSKPLEGMGTSFMEFAELYDIDPSILVGIGFLESHWGYAQRNTGTKNAFGLKGKNVLSYESWEAGMEKGL
jgi:RHS repeat-associated protein